MLSRFRVLFAGKSYVPMVPYGVKNSRTYKESKRQQRLAMEASKRQREMKGLILDSKKTLMMSLRDNTGINWYKAKQILKHLEMHWRQPNINSLDISNKITQIISKINEDKLQTPKEINKASGNEVE